MHNSDKWLPDVDAVMLRVLRCEAYGQAGVVAEQHLATGGKRLRARLALAASEALGAAVEVAIAWSAACELLHNATLIHDDLQDADRLRRGQPTAWARHGVAQAINGGDLLFVLPFTVLSDIPCRVELRSALMATLARHAAAVIGGQAMELELNRRGTPDRASYEKAVHGKTSALFELPVEGAALLAGRAGEQARALAAAFAPLGLLFQIQDDVLDLFGDKGRGAPGADIREGKISALVVEYVGLHPEQTEALLAMLRGPHEAKSDELVISTIERFREGGALASACRRIDRQVDELRTAKALDVEPKLRAVAQELVDLVLQPIVHLR